MYEIFKRLMEERGITAYKVSKDTGISSQTLSAWKKDIYTPKREKMELLANYFDVSVDYLMGRTPYRKPLSPIETLPPECQEAELTCQIKEIAEEMKKLKDTEREEVIRFVYLMRKMDNFEFNAIKQAMANIEEMQRLKRNK